MELLNQIIKTLPVWAWAALAAGVVAAVIILKILIVRFLLTRSLKKLIQDPRRLEAFRKRHTPGLLYRRSRIVEKVARKTEPRLLDLLDMPSVWLERLKERGRKRDFERLLACAPDIGLFQCFLLSLKKKRLAPRLLKWLEESKDILALRRLALSGRGEKFDGRLALERFKERLELVREMTGDPEWPARYFALKILLFDRDDRSLRALWDTFRDPHPLVRRTVAEEFVSGEQDRLYQELLKLAISDPVIEVRRAAWSRIHSQFKDRPVVEPSTLNETEVLHLLEFLRTGNKEEENLALQYLAGDNLELRFAAARFLDHSGALRRLALGVDMGDRQALKRARDLLGKASEVNVTSFCTCAEESSNPATLLLCAGILKENGPRGVLTAIARKVFGMYHGEKEMEPLYHLAVEAVAARGTGEAMALLNQEVRHRRNEPEIEPFLLSSLPSGRDSIFLATLLEFFKDPDFKFRDPLRAALKKANHPQLLEEIFTILNADRSRYRHPVRMETVKLLGELGLPYCLEAVLENLSQLTVEEAKEYTRVLAKFPKKRFEEKTQQILESSDAPLRASLIACLPATGEREFLKTIREATKDADPQVRIASVWSLVDYQDFRSLQQAVGLLRDPVERVRLEAGRAFGAHGSEEALALLKTVLFDTNEMAPVKTAVIRGLARSESLTAIDILVERLDQEEELKEELLKALAGKITRKELAHLVEDFKDSSPALRDKLTEAFTFMEEDGERAMVELLREDIPSLKPLVAEILEKTGHVEARIRKLAHRDPVVRRESAEFLSLVGTTSAFRGMVLAARDPDEDVRVRVIKALEKLETTEGSEILEALKNDPDRRVRTYTLWALERLRAKSL